MESLQPVKARKAFTAHGQVQGVGFRPFIYRLAHELNLTGHVGNTSDGVRIEVQGETAALELFPLRLRSNLPPLARLTGLSEEKLPLLANEETFTITPSSGHHGHTVLISPDVGICPDCLKDMRDPSNRRYRYPFTNCTNCGPRYTITRSIPYDRKTTSMACFPLCPDCNQEYTNPLDRRFHAQPIACPACGPALWFIPPHSGDKGSQSKIPSSTGQHPEATQDAVMQAVQALLHGNIVAIRGLGGFQLACDARNPEATALLRRRKHRPHKAFALMAGTLATMQELCLISPEEEKLLQSPARPVVVLRRRMDKDAGVLAPDIAPDTTTLGLMLPTTPLHILLFDLLDESCKQSHLPSPVLVMTSGNTSGEPICLGNREALQRLSGIADAFLLHNRDILCRVDDSVLAIQPGQPPASSPQTLFFRRARGYVPEPLSLCMDESDACVLGAGAGLKATVCFTRGREAFTGQHIGDLENTATAAFYEESTRHLMHLLEVTPALIVADKHPDFFSTRFAIDLASRLDVPCLQLQHHAAHAAAVLAENQLSEPALVLTLDGTGLGMDNTVWGGEILRMDLATASWQRLGHLSTFGLPGGDAAVREPWRIALALSYEAQDQELLKELRKERGKAALACEEMLRRSINSPRTSSCGRLFDACSAALGLCSETSYEGQAAIRLETAATQADNLPALFRADIPPLPDPHIADDKLIYINSAALFKRICLHKRRGISIPTIARDFHWQLAAQFTAALELARAQTGLSTVGLSGGVLNNRLLAADLCHELETKGFRVLVHHKLPPGDGGLSLGQAAWGRRLLALGQI